jgi:ribosomal-protein-alanine N-acetyltransferase
MSGVLMTERYLSSMTEGDLDEIALVERAAYEFPWTRGNFEDSLRNGYYGVCLRHLTGVLIGYCVLMPVVCEMHLLNLCVAPAAQGHGAGLALLREAVRLTRAQRLESVLLEVRPSNLRAIRLYDSFGFASIGRRKNYYPARHRAREDAIVMRYTLPEDLPRAQREMPTAPRPVPQIDGAAATPRVPNGASGSMQANGMESWTDTRAGARIDPRAAHAADNPLTDQEHSDGAT